MTDTDTDTDRAAFLRAILDRPDDDLPRLVFADWLEENGDADRAEFIRVQCELARCSPKCTKPGSICRCVAGFPGVLTCAGLRARELFLFETLRDRLTAECEHPVYLARQKEPGFGTPETLFVGYGRGFPATVRGPLAAFWEDRACGNCAGEGDGVDETGCRRCRSTGRVSGPTPAFRELVRREPLPLDGVVVTDREPWSPEQPEPGDMDYCWWRESVWAEHREIGRNALGNLPDALFGAMADLHPAARMSWGGGSRSQHVGFPTHAAAVAALSRALVTIGRG